MAGVDTLSVQRQPSTDLGWGRGGKLLRLGFCVFLAGFFLIPDGQPHNNVFYLTGLAALFMARSLGLGWFLRAPAVLALLAFMALGVLSHAWNPQAGGEEALEHAKDAFYLLTFLYVAARFGVSEIDRLWAERVLVVAAALGALLAMVLFFGEWGASHHGRMVGWGRLDHPNVMASAMAIAAVFAGHLAVRDGGWRRGAWLLCLVLVVSAAWFTQSRTGLLAVVAAAFVLAWFSGGWVRWLSLAVLLTGVALLVAAQFFPEHWPRILSLSDEARVAIYTDTLRKGMEAPWFGHGVGGEHMVAEYRGHNYHPHNFLLMAFYNLGVAGVLLLTVSLVLAGRALISGATTDRWLAAALTVGIVCMSTEAYHLIHRPGAPYLYFWLPFAWALARERRLSAETGKAASAKLWRTP
ncbi:O-antigen ligase family protein [Alkalilimnicola sp. S0819]|nr:O-antigen ligase family protein [Alkalilimnicola sp. S0819]